jgi:hypothetical protein
MRYIVTLHQIITYRCLVEVEACNTKEAFEKAVATSPKDWQVHTRSKITLPVDVANGIEQVPYTFEDPSPRHPVEDWVLEVQNRDTCLGYHEWVEHREESCRFDPCS